MSPKLLIGMGVLITIGKGWNSMAALVTATPCDGNSL